MNDSMKNDFERYITKSAQDLLGNIIYNIYEKQMEDCYINAKEEHIEYLRDKISKSLNSKDRELLDDLLSSIEEVDSNYSTAVFITGIKYGFFMHKNFDSITEKESIIIDNILKKLSEKT